jgi:Asp-tRNA(Asn)/Glu-tRNA(Gln) amidotransferase A subunit family amidase
VGVQLMSRAWDETSLLAATHAYQQETDWHLPMPEFC